MNTSVPIRSSPWKARSLKMPVMRTASTALAQGAARLKSVTRQMENNRDRIASSDRRRRCERCIKCRQKAKLGGLPADLFLPPGDIGVQRLGDRRVERWRLVAPQQFFPDRVGALGAGLRAGILPVLEIAPVAEHRLVERLLEPREGMAGAEEMSAGAHLADRVEAEAVLVDPDRVQ